MLSKILGLIVLFFALYTFLACLSYLFTWQQDQSILHEVEKLDKAVEVHNVGGKLGYFWSRFLITTSFGLGSFAFIVLLGAIAYRLLAVTRRIKLFKIVGLAATGALLFSLLLAYISGLVSDDIAFGGGLGGFAGAAVINWMTNLIGSIAVAFVLAIFTIVWLVFVSKTFSEWLAKVGDQAEIDQNLEAGSDTDESLSEDLEEVVDENSKEDFKEGLKEEIKEELKEELKQKIEKGDLSLDMGEGIEVITGDPYSTEVTEDLPRINTRDELPKFTFPPIDLLEDYADGYHEVSKEELEANNNKIRTTLMHYKIKVDKVVAKPGPTVTLYKVTPAPGVKISSIRNVEEDIAISLKAKGVRVVKLADAVGIEVANNNPSIVPLKSMLNDDSYRNSEAELPVALGYTITQKVKVFDLADSPHILMAGATKQGKSVGLNVIISSLLYKKHPSELKLVFVDPKMVEFTAYKNLLKHYLAVLPTAANEEEEAENAIVKQPKEADLVLNSLCVEMDERYKLLSVAGVNDIKDYNDKYERRRLNPKEGHRFLPYIVVVIDEYADLTMSGGPGGEAKAIARNITNSIIRLAQKGRAAGLHVIIATQRPTVNVVTGQIKTNFPTRMAYRVVSRVDSSVILDSPGAENLIGRGDMIYYAGVEMERVQCAMVSMDEVKRITKFIGDQTKFGQAYSTPYYLPMPQTTDADVPGMGMVDMSNLDELFEDAARLLVQNQKGSISDLQRRLGVGFARAGKIMDQLTAAGIVSPPEGSKPRQVLVEDYNELDEVLSAYLNR